MRTDAPGQSALLMLDVAEMLAARGVRYAVVGAMAAAVHGVVRASLDAVAVVALQVREAHALRQAFLDSGYEAELRVGDADDPIPALLALGDPHRNRVDLLIVLRGMDPEALNRTQRVALMGSTLQIVGREDFVAMKAFAGGPVVLRMRVRSWTRTGRRLISNCCVDSRNGSVVTRRRRWRPSSAARTEVTKIVSARPLGS
jgi:predicted nucleotidyltransferase